MKRVLIAYEYCPEGVSFYDVTCTEEQLEVIKTAHNKMVNNDEMNEGMETLNIALCGYMEDLEDKDKAHPLACAWKDCRVTGEELAERGGNFDSIIYTGFIL